MKLYLVRHGQTEANLNRTHSGWGDVCLTEKGREQARRIGKTLEKIDFDKIYTSDLSRAVETGRLALPDREAELCKTVREINVGNLARRPIADCEAEYGEEYIHNRKTHNYKPYGGESYEEFRSRVRSFLEMMENSPYEKVAAFCHGGFIHTALDVVMGKFNDRSTLVCGNCGVTVFEYDGKGWKLITWNYTGEL